MLKQLAVPALILAALAALALWGLRQQSAPEPAQAIVCADPVAGCAFVHQGAHALIRFSTRPEALRPFTIRLELPAVKKASASFQMEGMDMGFNRYDFRPQVPGIWQATVTLPVCTVSRVDWIAQLDLDGTLYRVRFVTQK